MAQPDWKFHPLPKDKFITNVTIMFAILIPLAIIAIAYRYAHPAHIYEFLYWDPITGLPHQRIITP